MLSLCIGLMYELLFFWVFVSVWDPGCLLGVVKKRLFGGIWGDSSFVGL